MELGTSETPRSPNIACRIQTSIVNDPLTFSLPLCRPNLQLPGQVDMGIHIR
jgi:hypothetical protein